MTDLEPEEALTACHDAGLEEGAWVRDVRAGDCQITTLTASVVILANENGQPYALDGANVLFESYCDGGIRLEEDEP